MTVKKGRIEVICGCMFSGKSEELIRRVKRAVIAKQHVQVFKPQIDTRYNHGRVNSHSGHEYDAIPVGKAMEILTHLADSTTVVGIDEAQFFGDGICVVVTKLSEKGVRVIIAGLDMDFRGEPFGFMPWLLTKANDVQKLHAICMSCTEEASRTQRLVNGEPAYWEDPLIVIGASENYEARCADCHCVPHREESK